MNWGVMLWRARLWWRLKGGRMVREPSAAERVAAREALNRAAAHASLVSGGRVWPMFTEDGARGVLVEVDVSDGVAVSRLSLVVPFRVGVELVGALVDALTEDPEGQVWITAD